MIEPSCGCLELSLGSGSCHTALWLIFFILWCSGLNPAFCRAKYMCSTTELLSQAFFCFVLCDGVSLALGAFLKTHKADLELPEICLALPQVLGLKAASTNSLVHFICSILFLQTWFTVRVIFHLSHPLIYIWEAVLFSVGKNQVVYFVQADFLAMVDTAYKVLGLQA